MKTAALFLVVLAFIGVIFGLWQLQPQTPKTDVPQKVEGAQTVQSPPEQITFTPKDNSVLTSKTAKFSGKMLPSSIVFIITNDLQLNTKSEADGSFESDVALSPGLNLVDIVSITNDLTKESKKSLSVYLASDSSNGNSVFAGSVKTIFDNLITLTTINGEQNLKIASSTKINLQKDTTTNQPLTPTKDDIRIGDYLVALGDLGTDNTMQAKNLTISRTDKPQNNEQYAVTKILTSPKSNIFTAKTNSDSKILELSLTKDSQVSVAGNAAKTTDIAKDKSAIIFYSTTSDKKIADLIYLLP